MEMELVAVWDTTSALWLEEALVAESVAVLVLAMEGALDEVMAQPRGVLSVAA